MTQWIPTIVTVVLTLVAALGLQDKVAANPMLAAIIAGVYAIVKGLLKSPVA